MPVFHRPSNYGEGILLYSQYGYQNITYGGYFFNTDTYRSLGAIKLDATPSEDIQLVLLPSMDIKLDLTVDTNIEG